MKDHTERTFFVVRNPYDRLVSCFLDKFRKQPMRVLEPGFQWQACHQVMYSHCGIRDHDQNAEKAEKFLSLTFDEFINELPMVFTHDQHFHPQSWSRRVHVGNLRVFTWPASKVVKMESFAELQQIPDIDWSTKANSTEQITRDFVLTSRHKAVIRQLYADDFRPCGYVP